MPRTFPLPGDDFPTPIRFAKDARRDLTVVGPEGPLAAGIVDGSEKENSRIFGPSKAAAELEASKVLWKTCFRMPMSPRPEHSHVQ